jgi:hypothetical protein
MSNKITEEQQAKITKLSKDSRKRILKSSLINTFVLILELLILNILNIIYVHSQTYLFWGSFLTGFVWWGIIRKNHQEENARIEKELKDILKG